jgi:hypothetical protein
MRIVPILFGLGRTSLEGLWVWSLGLVGLVQVSAAPASGILSVPAQDLALPMTVNLPAGLRLDGAQRWQLVETPTSAEPIPVDIVSSEQGGKPAQALVGVVSPRPGALNPRRFRLIPTAPTGEKLVPLFRFEPVSDQSLELREGTRPVFVYNHGIMSRPDVPADRNRSTYLHPIYGLDGEVLTDDFPKDHYHHRGLFWAWPHVRIEGVNYDLWDIRGIHQRFERWLDRHTGPAAARLGILNGWYAGEKKVMQERVWCTVYPAAADDQVIDLDFTWTPLDRPITLAGAEQKSYGGLTLRYAPRTQTVITTPLGNAPEDLAMTRMAWADLSARFAGRAQPSGAAVFISPDHPDYPPTWLTRHYGVLCVGWPGVDGAIFQPGEAIRCRYRVWLHRGAPTGKEIERAYEGCRAAQRARWEPAPD